MIRLSILVLILLLMGIHVVMAESMTGNVTVNIFNVNGRPASSMRGVVYGILVNTYNEQGVGPIFMNNDSQLVFEGIPPGTYILYVYYYPKNTVFNYTEYWGNLPINVFPGKASIYNFTRDMPWIENLTSNFVYNNAIEITIRINNTQAIGLEGFVTVYILNGGCGQEPQVITKSITLGPGVNTVILNYMPSQPGTYYTYVVLNILANQPLGQSIATDQYGCVKVITLYSVSFMETGLPPGTSWSITLNGVNTSSTTSSITLLLPNGTYQYQVQPVSGYVTNITRGNLTVSGPVTIGISFKHHQRMLITTYVIIALAILIALITAVFLIPRVRSRNVFDDVATA